jgi:GTP pyrophosphokinase
MSTNDLKSMNKLEEEALIQEEFNKLISEYLNTNHRRKVELITSVFQFANKAHHGVNRLDGSPYIMHPLAVARIVCTEMGLGSTSICSALLHDVIEDVEYIEKKDIEENFGKKIADIVEGLTKISGGKFGEKASIQAENFRKLLLTMNSDIRVILVKIADRLHNMRTLGSMRPDKQYKIAGETLYIYAPLAHKLGFFSIKSELEDLSLKYEHPKDYSDIQEKIEKSETNRGILFENFAEPVKEKLDKMGLKYEMRARVKSVYSIWNKMQTKNIPFEDIYDLYAVRIIFEPLPDVDEKNLCWDIYSAITDIYKISQKRTRDWVSTPKANGYQALHLTVMGPDGQWIEIQIRSQRMDEIAEKGFAAHWKYKGDHDEEDSELGKWLQTITEILEHPNPNALDFLDTIKLNLFSADISVFTPKGDIKILPQGATALDFAYDLHTDIGNRCIGAKVNRRLVPLSYRLSSGDQIEIITSRSQEPQTEWMQFVATAKARTKIDQTLKRIRKEEAKKGEEKVLTAFRKAGIETESSKIDKLAVYFGFPKREDFLYSVEKGNVILPENLKKIIMGKANKTWFKSLRSALGMGAKSNIPQIESNREKPTFDKNKPYVLTEDMLNIKFIIAQCCKPIPGDDALGFINDDGKIVVHKRACSIATRLKSSFGNRILSTEWSTHAHTSFEATLEVKGIDELGVLSTMTKVISDEFNVNIQRLVIEAKDGVFEGKIKLKVHDVKAIQRLCTTLSKISSIKSVWRVAD